MAYTTINKSTDYFTPFTFTGSGSAGTRTGVGFTPDMFIHKNRDNNQGWGVIDVIRGNGNYLSTNTTNAEASDVGNYGITTDGYTFPNGDQFFNSGNMVYWNWKAGGSGSSNTDGSITTTVSANTTAGFSIVSYTGTGSNATVGHGLGVVPKMIIVKDRTTTRDWFVYHNSIGNANRLKLNDTAASGSSTVWNSTTPTSSVFSIDSQVYTNASGNNFIAYCFAEKTGYSKFGSYTGNGNADGAFVYTGFKPAFVMIKRTGGVQDWIILDNKRPEYNETNRALYANANYDDTGTDKGIDILSNGFKLRKNHEAINYSENYIYMAFGQSLVGSNNVPCTAR